LKVRDALYAEHISYILLKTSNREYLHFNEESLQLMFYLIALHFTGCKVKIETEANDGYIDLTLLPGESTLAKFYHLIELKYKKVGELTFSNVKSDWSKGIDELKKNKANDEIAKLEKRYLSTLIIFVVLFSPVWNRLLINKALVLLHLRVLVRIRS
jgi:hypothetical protein